MKRLKRRIRMLEKETVQANKVIKLTEDEINSLDANTISEMNSSGVKVHLIDSDIEEFSEKYNANTLKGLAEL